MRTALAAASRATVAERPIRVMVVDDAVVARSLMARWVDAEPEWEIAAPHPLSVVCFRHVPPGMAPEAVDAHNVAVMDAVNAGGEVFLSSTRLHGRVVLRIAIGNEGTTRDDVALAWSLLRLEASA